MRTGNPEQDYPESAFPRVARTQRPKKPVVCRVFEAGRRDFAFSAAENGVLLDRPSRRRPRHAGK